ncbi:solute carrier family 2, facilitated glucose transporter member 12-like [Saccoglossus kowalevskii]|uniref:Solute carrier family 2, facilitated glucose transporter member 12-like n=1 Tax=Saccoglossus kowalevskii TaxID=10224 RepID=A0ABM0LXT4_SACKO|nr:PREDICTED: solute carrier family 2, facilitated glucose transporter member 12-like [Saccoglossus kowalevskii]
MDENISICPSDDLSTRNGYTGIRQATDDVNLDTVLLLSQNDEDMEDDLDNKSLEPLELVQSHQQQNRVTAYLVLASVMAAFGGILFGYDIGIISGALLQLREVFHLDCFQQEVVVSALLLGALIGSLVGGFIIDAIGRRWAIIFNDVIFVIGAIILLVANTFTTLVAGRLIIGFAVSLSVIGECIYISEISPAKRRGSLVSLNELGITVGLLLAYLVNFLFITVRNGWRYMFGLSMIPAIVQGIGMYILPPSPRYLIIRKRDTEARNVLVVLRGSDNVDEELMQITTSIHNEKDYSVCDLFRSVDNMRGRLFIGVGLVFFQQVTGQTNVLYYAPTVFQLVGFKTDSVATLATIGLGGVKALSTIVCLLSVDKVGRRRFLLFGAFCMMVVIMTLGIITQILPSPASENPCRDYKVYDNLTTTDSTPYLTPLSDDNVSASDTSVQKKRTLRHLLGDSREFTHLQNKHIFKRENIFNISANSTDDNNSGSQAAKYVALISLMLYVAAYSIGFGPVTWILLSEIFPSGIRGRATSFATVVNWGTNLVISLTFLNLVNGLGISWTFILYGFICAASIVFVYLFVPETKNRSLEQVSADINRSSLYNQSAHRCHLLPCCHDSRQLHISHSNYSEVDRTSNMASLESIPSSLI